MSAPIEDSRQQQLRTRLHGLGFAPVRFAAVPAPAAADADGDRGLRRWLAAGHQADMHWMDRSLDKRLNPDLVLPGVRSIIMLGVSYWTDRPQRAIADPGAPRWARYALYEDYHDTMKPGLVAAGKALEELYGVAGTDYRYYVDTGPVIDRGWAARAGIGFIGKNAMLISREHGNWLFLAAILTRIAFAPDEPVRKTVNRNAGSNCRAGSPNPAGLGATARGENPVAASVSEWNAPRRDEGVASPGNSPQAAVRAASGGAAPTWGHTPTGDATPPSGQISAIPEAGLLCGKCTRCLDACPTDAFTQPGVVDARRCISYQTIENKGVIPRELRPGIGQRIYGCDVCLEVCPWNRFAREGRRLLLAARDDLGDLPLADILALTPERFAEVFRRTPIKRLKLVGLLRNACIVAGNSGDRSLLPLLTALATSHALPLVRAHAVWAVHRLGAGAALIAARAAEQDPIVLAEYAAEEAAQ